MADPLPRQVQEAIKAGIPEALAKEGWKEFLDQAKAAGIPVKAAENYATFGRTHLFTSERAYTLREDCDRDLDGDGREDTIQTRFIDKQSLQTKHYERPLSCGGGDGGGDGPGGGGGGGGGGGPNGFLFQDAKPETLFAETAPAQTPKELGPKTNEIG